MVERHAVFYIHTKIRFFSFSGLSRNIRWFSCPVKPGQESCPQKSESWLTDSSVHYYYEPLFCLFLGELWSIYQYVDYKICKSGISVLSNYLKFLYYSQSRNGHGISTSATLCQVSKFDLAWVQIFVFVIMCIL